jgi:muconate cycloisomerase
MNITKIETRPLRIPYRKPFHWAQGVITAAEVVLVSVHTDEGVVGYGESMSSGSAVAVQALIHEVASLMQGRSPFQISVLMRDAYHHLFAARGSCSAPRFGALVLAGLDMALWDISGKAAGRSVYDLLGGAYRNDVNYFGFAQGDSAEEVAADAKKWGDLGAEVIYVKVGRGNELDVDITRRVREAIGDRRLRLDANEAWDMLTAQRMASALQEFNIEVLEQPTSSNSLAALAQIRSKSPIPIAADQIVFTPNDVYSVCRGQAADLIVLGLHETGGVGPFCKAAAIAEAAGLNVCLHGLYETGLTTCASNQVGAAISNLDDANQYMNHLLVEDIVQTPDLRLKQSSLPVLSGPGWGFELNWDAVARAEETYRTTLGDTSRT